MRKFLSALFLAALAQAAWAQIPGTYENDGQVLCPPDVPPNIDATNFVNNGRFLITFTNSDGIPFDTQNTVNYTNTFTGFMNCNTGFRLDTYTPSDLPTTKEHPASGFFNAGTIACGTTFATSVLIIGGTEVILSGGQGGAKCLVTATNIVNPGVINMGVDSLLNLSGSTVDLTRGTLTMENTGFDILSSGTFFNGGFLDGYWGIGDSTLTAYFTPPSYQTFNPTIFQQSPATTPEFAVTNRDQTITFNTLGGTPSFLSYLSDTTDASGSNRTVRAVFLNNTNYDITAKVFFPIGGDVIEWSSVITNLDGVFTNYMYLYDTFGFRTNLQLAMDGTAGAGGNRPTFMPVNYNLFENGTNAFSFGTAAQPTIIPTGTFISGNVTNQYAAYQALFEATSTLVSEVAHQDVTNLAGRIEINADHVLNLARAHITSENFLSLRATNHYAGLSPGRISTPWADFNLRSTNGLLYVTNIIEPFVSRPEGCINLYSARWTNYLAGITNAYHVLFVDTELAPTFPARVEDLVLRSTNTLGGNDSIVISDVLTVSRSFLLDSSRLTLTTNPPGAIAACGTLNLLGSSIVWPTSTPRLQYLTNYGAIQMDNAAFLGGDRTSPYFTTTFNEPYDVFINEGTVTNFGSLIWARLFQNSGTFFAWGGGISLQQAQDAYLTNGAFFAAGGDISISTDTLLVSNHVFQAGGVLTLAVSSYLDDGSLQLNSADFITNKNTWTVNNGFTLPLLPPQASLLGTTIIATNPSYFNQSITWAGADLGCSPAGFSNNAALGHVVLVGGASDSLFTFAGPNLNTNYALYVDELEFLGSTVTNTDKNGNWIGVQIAPGMKVYFGQALANGVSIAEKLNGKSGGGFCWVSNYNCGFFSSTNWPYPNFTTNRVNTALAESCDIDSWAGITNFPGGPYVNCLNPFGPIPPQLLPNCNVSLPLPPSTNSVPPVSSPTNDVPGGSSSGSPKLDFPPAAPAGSVSNTFASVQGNYSGLFADTNGVALSSSGFFSAKTTASGAFSAKVMLSGRTYSVSGRFDPITGLALKTISLSSGTSLIVQLQLDYPARTKSAAPSRTAIGVPICSPTAWFSTNPSPKLLWPVPTPWLFLHRGMAPPDAVLALSRSTPEAPLFIAAPWPTTPKSARPAHYPSKAPGPSMPPSTTAAALSSVGCSFPTRLPVIWPAGSSGSKCFHPARGFTRAASPTTSKPSVRVTRPPLQAPASSI